MIKKTIIYILLIIAFTLLITGCKSDLYPGEPDSRYMISEISRFESEFDIKNQQIKEFDIIIKNFNLLLSTVYYGTAKSVDEGKNKNFTAFGMMYKEEYYLITAGHCIKYDGIEYINFGFKSNFSGLWVFPELIDYNNDSANNNDYAIFKHSAISRGLIVDEIDKEPVYVLGNINRKINIFKKFNDAVEGESGSPILNSGGKLVGITIKNNGQFTPIEVVTDALDELISSSNGPAK